MIVPTVLATIARRSCRLCSASESWPMAISVVVISISSADPRMLVLFPASSAGLHAFVLLRDVLACVICQHRNCDETDHSAGHNVEGDREARSKGGKQRRRDKWRGAAGDDRGQLIAERGAAVAQAGREALCNQRRLGAVTRHRRKQRQCDRDKHQARYLGVQQRKVDEAEDPDKN